MEKATSGLTLPENLLLASGSPRRKQLMESMGAHFNVATRTIEETWPKEISTDNVAEYLAKEKAKRVSLDFSNQIIITADTIVVFAGQILGKPADETEAFKMLSMLSGKFHEVITGVCIMENSKVVSFSDKTRVQFKDLTAGEISYYIQSFNPMDKAGAYGIQEWIGMIGIKYMEGSYFNVMGLAVHKVYDHLINWK